MSEKCSSCLENNNGWCNIYKTNKMDDKIIHCFEICNSKYHDLKIKPVYFEAVLNGYKTFEIRFNDRDFRVGDFMILREWDGDNYTDRSVTKRINYMLEGEHLGLQYKYCVIGFK